MSIFSNASNSTYEIAQLEKQRTALEKSLEKEQQIKDTDQKESGSPVKVLESLKASTLGSNLDIKV